MSVDPHNDARTIADEGERALIERIRRRAGHPPPGIAVGIGDDAAVVAPPRGRQIVLSTDTLVEGVHFRFGWCEPQDVGRKAVAVNLSDLAAMGATPRALLLSLCLPRSFPLADFDALVVGVLSEASAAGAALAGGNITESREGVVIGVTALGDVHSRRMLLRSGGRAGDELYVTGEIGAAAAGLAMLQTGSAQPDENCVARYRRPSARLACGRWVASYRAATAGIDLSDGLVDAVRQVATASGTGAVVDAGNLPVAAGARKWWESQRVDPVQAALTGGEDYELLFAVPPRRRRAFVAAISKCQGVKATRVGTLTGDGVLALESGEQRSALPAGFTHFADK